MHPEAEAQLLWEGSVSIVAERVLTQRKREATGRARTPCPRPAPPMPLAPSLEFALAMATTRQSRTVKLRDGSCERIAPRAKDTCRGRFRSLDRSIAISALVQGPHGAGARHRRLSDRGGSQAFQLRASTIRVDGRWSIARAPSLWGRPSSSVQTERARWTLVGTFTRRLGRWLRERGCSCSG
jgi:hypothetical protein